MVKEEAIFRFQDEKKNNENKIFLKREKEKKNVERRMEEKESSTLKIEQSW